MKLICNLIIILTTAITLPLHAGDDLGAAFLPESGKEVRFVGKREGNAITCGSRDKKKSKRNCQRKFDSLYRSAVGTFSGTFPGYIEEEGKPRQDMLFAAGTLTVNGVETRLIYEVDGYDEPLNPLDSIGVNGLFWLDPNAK